MSRRLEIVVEKNRRHNLRRLRCKPAEFFISNEITHVARVKFRNADPIVTDNCAILRKKVLYYFPGQESSATCAETSLFVS